MNSKMLCCKLLLLLMIQLMFFETDATLSHGFAPRWILERFCKGKSGIAKLPWNCRGYLQCTSSDVQVSGTWIECERGLQFDEITQGCVQSSVICPDSNQTAHQECPGSPDLKFPHPGGCALYYDCSQTHVLDQFRIPLMKYENECSEPQLFDPDLGYCRDDQPDVQVQCSNKPKSKADYRKSSASTSLECNGKANGMYPKTSAAIFPTEYIQCVGGAKITRQCNKTLVFDPVKRQCTSDITVSLQNYCQNNPQAVFPDSQHCGRYYNCSLTTGINLPNPYQSECLYMYLYDVARETCVTYNNLTVPCGTRDEPINPCDYKVGHCINRTHCIPCEAKCKGKPDGTHPYPTLENTRFHLLCKEGRTQDILKCGDKEIYSEQQKQCQPAGVANKFTTTTPSVTSLTEPPFDPIVDPTIDPQGNVTVEPQVETSSVDPPVNSTVDPPVDSATVPHTEQPVCGCLDDVIPMETSLKNLSSFVDAMHVGMQVGSPYDCNEPPLIQDSILKVTYEFDVAVARYECMDGYSACGGQMKSTCAKDNIWNTSSLGDCFQSRWTKVNNIVFPCDVLVNSALLIRGRSIEDMFTFSLSSNDGGETLLYVLVRPTTRETKAGKTSVGAQDMMAPISLTGETIWIIELKSKAFEISVNGRYLTSVTNSSPLSLIHQFFISDVFQTEEIKYLPKGIASDWKHPVDVNLALNKVTSASSEYELAVSGRAVDGYSHVLWEEQSCWAAKSVDTKPWWMVDLGKEFYVSHVFLTSFDCEGSTICGKHLQNFEVNVHKTDPTKDPKSVKKVCFTYFATFPSRSVSRIDCTSDVVGRFVMIIANGAISDHMIICEVEVYGGLVIRTGWSPFSCPDPPMIGGASVQLSYTDSEAMATYKCHGSAVMCTENNVLHCHNQTGWDEAPGTCIETIHDAGIGGSVPGFPICRLNLGSGIELWATPKYANGYLALIHESDTMLKLTLKLEDEVRPTALTHIVSGIESQDLYPPKSVFAKGKESHIIISALTDQLMIEVDGEVFYKFPVDKANIHKAVSVEFSDSFRVRKSKIYPGFIFDVLREPIEGNLALSADVEASSGYANPESYAVDGNPSQPWPTGSCWNADIRDTKQWYQVDLGKQYFIRDIKLDLRSISKQKTLNLALHKETFGSPNYNFKSSQNNVVDGDHVNIPTFGSCFSSSTSADEPWWMVDLGKEYTVSSVAIQPSASVSDDHHSGLSITIHDINPRLNAYAQSTVCAEKIGPWGYFERVPCRKPTSGQFVMVKRMTGARKGIMTLCEVEVYESLESKLHDFTINIYEENPQTESSAVKRQCVKHEGEFPKDDPTKLTCAENIWGRYVRIEADVIRGQYDMMTLCEVEIYGDKAVKKEWSPNDCPNPPKHHNAFVSVFYTPKVAEARYKCFDNYATCNGGNTITCSSKQGWIGKPELCRPRTFSAFNQSRLEVVHFCPLRLGEAIELYLTPTAVDSVLTLSAGANDVIEMKWTMTDHRQLTITTDLTTGKRHPPVFVELESCEIDKESKIVITMLSYALHVAIDEEAFYIKVETPHLIDSVSTVIATMGKLAILEAGVSKTQLKPSLKNLAGSRMTSASTMSPEAGRAVDGDLSSCWRSNTGDLHAWWTVELDSLYYVSNVKITTAESCGPDCDGRVHDFKVEMFHLTPAAKNTGELCLKYNGVLPHASTTTLTCSKNVYGRMLRISAPDGRNADDRFTLCEVEVFGGLVVKAVDGPNNLALFRKATTNSMYKDAALPIRAVDGNKNSQYAGGSCWMTATGEADPWWQVELDNYFYISHVEITSRIDCGDPCNNGVRDFQIEVYPQPPELGLQRHLCLQYDGVFPHSTTQLLECTNKELGRFLRISSYDRTETNSLFVLCEVEVFGEEVTVEESRFRNLARKRPVFASSRMVSPDRAVDGDKSMVWHENSCWASQDQDVHSWWMVELDDYYLVSFVELTSREDCGTNCGTQLRNFGIEMFYKRPGTHDIGDVCLNHFGVFPHSTTKKLQCTKRTLGRLVRITAHRLTICEVGVYGAKLRNTGWKPSDCPEPPALLNACVDVCYNVDHAVATYTCNTNYSMCTGSNSINCKSKLGGWEGSPGRCVQTTLEVHHGYDTDVQEFPTCFPRLGEGIEMWVTPHRAESSLELFGDTKAISLLITLDKAEEPLIVMRLDTKISLKTQEMFFLKRELHVVILFLTTDIILYIDGKVVANMSHIQDSARICYIRSSDGLKVRMVRPVDRYMDGIIRVQTDKNLALKKDILAASEFENFRATNLVDGDLSQSALSNKCWHAAVGETDQWLMIDLGEYYFVRELIIYNREVDNCTVCADRTHDFVINVLQTESRPWSLTTCAVYEGVLPLDAIQKIRCKEDVWGRFVRISATKIKQPSDLMTFCEIEVYGDKVLMKPWSKMDCPVPPDHDHASVQVSYSRGTAIATYTCDQDYTMCSGSNVLLCTSYDGWTGSLGSCLWTTRTLDYGRENDLSNFPICNLKLGEGIELLVFPKKSGWKVSLMLGEAGDTALSLVSTPGHATSRATISTVISGARGNEVNVEKHLFSLEHEAQFQIVFLSKSLLILVDGRYFTTYPHHLETAKITFIKSTSGVNIRKVSPLPRYVNGIVRTILDDNLALDKVTTPVSQHPNMYAKYLVDGNLNSGSGLCWSSAIGEKKQWVVIDLGDYYFIRELVLYTRHPCDGCNDKTHDYTIDILPNGKVDSETTRCAFYKGTMPEKAVEKIRCKNDAWGRYVRISNTKATNDQDLMTFCEIQVFGDVVDYEKKISFGAACSSTADCEFSKAFCSNGSCTCEVGHSYDSKTGTCVIECGHYGDSFAMYPGHGVVACNRGRTKTSSSEACMEACRNETSFFCINSEFEVYSGNCYMCDKSWYDVSPASRDTTSLGWTLFHRLCDLGP